MSFLISNLRRERAFDPKTGRIAVFALAAGAAGFASTAAPAQALPPICYALDTPCFHLSKPVIVQAPRLVRAVRPIVRVWHRPAFACAPLAAVKPLRVIIPRESVPTEPAMATAQAGIGTAQTSGGTEDVTLDFVGADIGDVLRALALQTHTSIVTGVEVRGTVTVALSHIDMETALRLITKLSGYEFTRVGGAYLVGAPAGIAQLAAETATPEARAETRILACRYADANLLAGAVQNAYPKTTATPGPAQDGDGGVVVVSGAARDVQSAREMAAAWEIAAFRQQKTLISQTFTTQTTLDTTTAQPGGGE